MARKDTEKVTRLVKQFTSLMDACDNTRKPWLKECEENLGYYMCDNTVIFGKDQPNDIDKVSKPAQHHVPFVTERVEAHVAATNSDDLTVRYIPKREQDTTPTAGGYTLDVLTRMGTAGFDSMRMAAGWHRHMHEMIKSVDIFDCHYLGVSVDYAKRFPEPMVDFVSYSPWLVYSTPGEVFEEASEVIVSKWVSAASLKAQYPEFADKIKDLSSYKDMKEDEKLRGTKSASAANSSSSNITSYGMQQAVVDDDAIQVLERWKLDTTLVEVSRQKDQQTIDAERMMIELIATPPTPNEPYEMQQMRQQAVELGKTGTLYFDVYQYHSNHIVDHVEHVEELQEKLSRSVAMPNGMGAYMEVPAIQDTVTRSAISMAIEALSLHIKMTDASMKAIPIEKEGMKPKYDGGWRQTCILGEEILAYDGVSIFYEKYGIQGAPLWEFEGMGHPLYHKGPSYVRTLIAHNRILDSTLNQIIDNGRLFSNISWWATESTLDDLEINNDPRKPIKIPDDKIFGKDFGILPAQEIPQSLFNLIGLDMSMAQSTAAISPAVEGLKQSGVRSGVQQQTQLSAGLSQLMYKMTRMKPSLEKLAHAFFKMVLVSPPDDTWVKPMVDNEVIKIDWETLRNTEFTIDVVIKPGGVASAEERSQILLGFLQNFGPLLAEIGMIDVNLEFLAAGIKHTMPDLAQVITQNIERIRQAQQEQQAQQQQLAQQEAQGGQSA